MLFHAENYEIKIEFVFNCVQIINIKENYNKVLENSIRNDVFMLFIIFSFLFDVSKATKDRK